MTKTFRLTKLLNGTPEFAIEFTGEPQAAQDAALELADIQVKKGSHVMVTCGDEVIFDSQIKITK